MLIFRFKVTFEDQDEFLREIELRSDQTFHDFMNALLSNLGLGQDVLSSFYICDSRFRKKQEISLLDMSPDNEEEGGQHVPVMADCRLSDYIDDPHQKLMFVYDYIQYWTFYIELLRIKPADARQSYPRISRSEGEVPRELTSKPGEGPDQIPGFEFPFADDEYDPEDLKGLDSEEDFSEEGPESFDPFDESGR